MNDNSTDSSVAIAKKSGARVYNNELKIDFGWPELQIRKNLLEIGRDYGGTHFICLDADELISKNLKDNLNIINNLQKKEVLIMQWVALWKRYDRYKSDKSVWSNNYKDFIFCDDGKVDFPDVWMHTPRTPAVDWKKIKVSPNDGCILHLQFVNWEAFQIKQCWYRCSELIESKGKNINMINNKYKITIDRNPFKNKYFKKGYEISKTSKTDPHWYDFDSLPDPNSVLTDSSWRLKQIEIWLKEYGYEYFKDLDIWHLDKIRNLKKY